MRRRRLLATIELGTLIPRGLGCTVFLDVDGFCAQLNTALSFWRLGRFGLSETMCASAAFWGSHGVVVEGVAVIGYIEYQVFDLAGGAELRSAQRGGIYS